MKEWKFKKQDLDCTLTINDEAVIKLKINDGASCDMEKLEQGAVHFFGNHHLIINGEEKVIRGLILDNYDEIKTYYDDVKNKIDSQYRKKKEKMLEGVQWNIKEYSERDEGGKTKSYKHTLVVNGEIFVFKKEIFLMLAALSTQRTKSQMDFPKAEYQVAKMENGFGWVLMMDGKKSEK